MDNFFDLYSLFFLVVGLFVFFRLYSVLGVRTERDEKACKSPLETDRGGLSNGKDDGFQGESVPLTQADECEAYAVSSSLPDGLFTKMRHLDSRFRLDSFLEGAEIAHETIIVAFEKGEKADLKPLLAPDVYEEFCRVIEERAATELFVGTFFVGISEKRITDGWLEGNKAYLTVSFVSDMVDVKLSEDDKAAKNVPRKVIDKWTFSRDLSSSNPNWLLVTTE
ncbi:MAG: Tim44/TimA family putative adaptor protein [Alphaproteobacteria bacterium]|nr:Tim44/TimA family putative adaptor protein [Alphaproteobacteria bacterium]